MEDSLSSGDLVQVHESDDTTQVDLLQLWCFWRICMYWWPYLHFSCKSVPERLTCSVDSSHCHSKQLRLCWCGAVVGVSSSWNGALKPY